MTTDTTSPPRPLITDDGDGLRLAMQEAHRLLDAGEPAASAAAVLRRAAEDIGGSLVVRWDDASRGSVTRTYTSAEEIAFALAGLAQTAGLPEGEPIVDPDAMTQEEGDAFAEQHGGAGLETMDSLHTIRDGINNPRARQSGPWFFSDGGGDAAEADWL